MGLGRSNAITGRGEGSSDRKAMVVTILYRSYLFPVLRENIVF
jgi:hypothetical protein